MNELQPGDLVRVRAGAFAELIGTVEEVFPDRAKLRVHLTVLGTAYRVELDDDDVVPYDPDERTPLCARWPRGTRVRILSGPFQELVGAVQNADDHCQMVVVRLTGLRPEVSVQFHYHEVESA